MAKCMTTIKWIYISLLLPILTISIVAYAFTLIETTFVETGPVNLISKLWGNGKPDRSPKCSNADRPTEKST